MSELAGLLRDLRIALRRAAVKPEPHDVHAPGKVILQMVAAGRREFTPEQRDWCLGEAMVLTGFKEDPTALLARGDQALATIVMQGSAQ